MPETKKNLNEHPSFKEKRNKFISNHPWIYWTFFYSLFVIGALIIAILFVNFFNHNYTDVNSARYLLSALMQSEASIIAIVITLTLVAVQLSASSYTPRVSKIFTESPHMYLILAIYIFSIALATFLLQILSGTEGYVNSGLEYWISWAYWLGILLVIALIPYIYYTLELFRPEIIIERLLRHITKETILDEKTDFFNSIFDIIHNSIIKYDTTTIRQGLTLVNIQIAQEISSNNSIDDNVNIVKIFCAHLERCARQTIELHDEEILEIVLNQFEIIGNYCSENNMDKPTWQVITIIVEIEKLIASEDIPGSLSKVTKILERIGKISIEKEFDDTPSRILCCQENIAKHAIDRINPQDDFSVYTTIVENLIDSIAIFIRLAITQKRLAIINIALSYLKSIGMYSLKKGNLHLPFYIAEKVLDLWLDALPILNNSIQFLDVMYLAYFAKKETVKKGEFCGYVFERKIIEIGTLSMEKSSEPEQNAIAILLAELRLIDERNYQYEIEHNVPNLSSPQKENYQKFLASHEKIYQEKKNSWHLD